MLLPTLPERIGDVALLNYERRGDAMVMTIDRPEALNALSFLLLEQMEICLREVENSDSRVLIVTGAGVKAFCAGADVTELVGRSQEEHRIGVERGQALFEKLSEFRMPTVAMINGYAFGGGLELALACDFRLASPNARLGFPEIKLGLIPGYGGTQRLPRLVGEGRALELILTGKSLSASEAEDMGLIHQVVDGDPIHAAIQFSQGFTRYSLATLAHARHAVKRGMNQPIHEGLKIEADRSTLAYQSDDASEGIEAFIEKRDPAFTDR